MSRLKSALMRDRKYVSDQEWEKSYHEKRGKKDSRTGYKGKKKMATGGRLKSALMRDRKYISNEPWEKNYVIKQGKKNTRTGYKGKAKSFGEGGMIENTYKDADGDTIYVLDTNATDLSELLEEMFYDDQLADFIYEDLRSDEGIELNGNVYYGRQVKFFTPSREQVEGLYYLFGGLLDPKRPKSALMRDRKYVSDEEWEKRYHAKRGKKDTRTGYKGKKKEFLFGGLLGEEKRPKSALMRDRKYVSDEEWEERYHAKRGKKDSRTGYKGKKK